MPGVDDKNFLHMNEFYLDVIKNKMLDDNIKVPGILVKDE
jgi:hypothetical protein